MPRHHCIWHFDGIHVRYAATVQRMLFVWSAQNVWECRRIYGAIVFQVRPKFSKSHFWILFSFFLITAILKEKVKCPCNLPQLEKVGVYTVSMFMLVAACLESTLIDKGFPYASSNYAAGDFNLKFIKTHFLKFSLFFLVCIFGVSRRADPWLWFNWRTRLWIIRIGGCPSSPSAKCTKCA